MATRFGNSGRGEITPGRPSNLDGDLNREKVTTGQPSNLDETNPGQPLQGELGDGSEQTKAKSIERELSPVWSKLRELEEQFRNDIIEAAEEYLKLPDIKSSYSRQFLEEELANLRSFLDKVSTNTEGAEGLTIMVEIAFEYIQRLGINDRRSSQLADLVVKIATELREPVRKIAFEGQFSYETRESALKGLISLMVNLILSVGPKFRGREPAKADTDHPNNALLTTLYFAANVLLGEAAADPQKLIGAVSSLLEMTKELRSDERELIYDEIRTKISAMMENGNIDDNLRKQFDEIINQLADQYQ